MSSLSDSQFETLMLLGTEPNRLRNDGLQTVSKLLHECRAENKILRDKNLQLEKTIDSLNLKIQKSAVSATLNSTGEGGGEGEKEVRSPPNQSFDEDHLPSSSKQLVENLIRENTKLKHQVHNPQKLDELNLRARSLQNLNSALKAEKNKLNQELESLISSIQQSENGKDKLILQLTTDLKHCRSERQHERSHRLTLEEELGKLNDELTDTAQKCLNMRKQLPSSTSLPPSQSHQRGDKSASTSQPSSLSAEPQSQFSNEKFLQEQNTRLEIKCNNLEQQLRASRGPASRPDNQLISESSMLKEQLADKDKQINKLKEHCQALSQQLKVYEGDFRRERQERERLIRDYSQLEDYLRELKAQQSGRANPANNAWDGRQQQAASRYKAGSQGVRFSMQGSKSQTTKDNQPKATNKGSQAKLPKTIVSEPIIEEDTISLSSQTDVVRPSLPGKQTDLACYKCDKKFGFDMHSDLIDHLDICTGT